MSLLMRNNGAILLLMFNIFLVFTGIGLVIPIMPTYMTELHISGTVGMLVAAFSLTQLLFSPLAGRLSDTMGRKNHHHRHDGVRRIGMVVRSASTPPLLFASRMLGGIGAALIMPAVMAYTADVTSNEERARGMGFITRLRQASSSDQASEDLSPSLAFAFLSTPRPLREVLPRW